MDKTSNHKSDSLQGKKFFFILLGFYVLFLGISLILWGYNESFLYLNGGQYKWLDWPMFLITHMGDSLVLVSVVSLAIITRRPDTVVKTIIVVIITGLFGQLLKQTLFDGWDRPLRVFNESNIIYTLPNYRLFHNSFPSGHSITAAAVFTILINDLKPRPLLQLGFAVIVILITYSRIYLGVHFPADVLAGITIGVVLTILIDYLISNKLSRINYSHSFRNIIVFISIVCIILGLWLLRIYFPFSAVN